MTALSDALAWTVVAAFLAGTALEIAGNQRWARRTAAGAWLVFAGFWLSVVPQFAFEMRSPIEGTLSLLAVPACAYTGYLLWNGRESLLVLSRAVGFMGLLYLPVQTVAPVRQFMIETVADQTDALMGAFGYQPERTAGPLYGYNSRFVFTGAEGHRYGTYIITACTGIGSIAIFGGLIAAVKAPLRRRLEALALAVGIIWVLNVVRNAFIAVAYGHQWFQQELLVSAVAGTLYADPRLTSYFVADRVISQGLSVVALVGITLVVVRRVPELLAPIEEAVYVATGREFDLADLVGVDDPTDDTAGDPDEGGGLDDEGGDPDGGMGTGAGGGDGSGSESDPDAGEGVRADGGG